VRAGYLSATGVADAAWRAATLSARTVVFDVEPLVASWDSGTERLDRGIALVLNEVAVVPDVQVVCFATNSLRRPTTQPRAAGLRVVYLAAAGKPLRTAAYRDFPRPGVVIGDQVATDGFLARRLRYTFVLYDPRTRDLPLGPRLMGACGRLLRPLLFTPAPGQTSHG
jgi:predicted HAD superfamily phosphohydrolase YqeG